MDAQNPAARRFPLVARWRPPCLPLPRRVGALAELAETAVAQEDPALASAVYNQAALLASDLGLPALARRLCRRHAAAYLHACPLAGAVAVRALEPVVNLARLRVRAGHGDDARRRLTALHDAVTTGTSAAFDGVTIPAGLARSRQDRHHVGSWLWRVLLADGTRTLTTACRWAEARAYIETHRGIGERMLDGRQVAVIAALAAHDTATATELLATTRAGEPWEQTVTACLSALCRRARGDNVHRLLTGLLDACEAEHVPPGLTVFAIRIRLTVLDIARETDHSARRRIVDELYKRTEAATDGYAARECLQHTAFMDLATDHQKTRCADLVSACALGSRRIRKEWSNALADAVSASDKVIQNDMRGTPKRKSKA
ncbi:hypothetical protein HNR12_001364 [Streptomonospora nanhaiensis]|uniref:Uncharacterized protein n=1 Tax=Streptomonospora nanhaiensis TaxID=1323731 RepID=A0A853BKB8_9ACTN|nr:hypothetical protein [Streptomonospora nanhaiensis]NYI95087.1 hypothetical protein [Streptomonospora nanhaiensis]